MWKYENQIGDILIRRCLELKIALKERHKERGVSTQCYLVKALIARYDAHGIICL